MDIPFFILLFMIINKLKLKFIIKKLIFLYLMSYIIYFYLKNILNKIMIFKKNYY